MTPTRTTLRPRIRFTGTAAGCWINPGRMLVRRWMRDGQPGRVRDLLYTVADQDYYLPLHRARDTGSGYEPHGVPGDWTRTAAGVWTVWTPSAHSPVKQGWKVHVSARFERAQRVLDMVAGICYDEQVAFKHLTCALYFLVLHHKHASRVQSGKFCTAYPPDVPTAHRLMERLSAELRDEDGPYILTDRRYGQSRTVHYRYGGFAERRLLRPDGTSQAVVEDAHGRLVEDRRVPAFTLPDGISDPFRTSAETTEPANPATLGGYAFDKPMRYSNAGGSYRGRVAATGREVFVKEARAHNGLSWDGSTAPERMRREHATLLAVHERAPGLCPEPLDYFRVWEHEFLVTEFIAGTPLTSWVAASSPFIQARADSGRYREYYQRCLEILDVLAASLAGLHQAGYAFVDLNPGNVVLDESGLPRLVDFEAASSLDSPLSVMGIVATPGYVPLRLDSVGDPVALDEYGLSALALCLLAPLHQPVQRNPDMLHHLRRDLDEYAPVPERLWRLVTRFHPSRADVRLAGLPAGLPAPGEVALHPRARLTELRDAVADGLLAMADHRDPDALFPTVPLGHATNTLCLAYGTAGVVHALHLTGREVPGTITNRLRTDALRRRAELPPGLHTGGAGIAWVLAELGLIDEAQTLLAAASDSPLARARATLGEGTAGLSMAHLALYHRTSDARHLDAAIRLARAIPDGPELVPVLGPGDAVGLLHGRTGIALCLFYLSRATGDRAHLDRGRRLLGAELARAISRPDGALSFPDSATVRRAMPYLFTGSAGVLFTAARYLGVGHDPVLLETIPRIRCDVSKHIAVLAGLYCGLAGLGFALAEYASLTGDDQAMGESLRIGAALFKYAVPGPAGVSFHGDRTYRFSADLWSGSAGVLLFLDRLLSDRPDALFTFDAGSAR